MWTESDRSEQVSIDWLIDMNKLSDVNRLWEIKIRIDCDR